MAALPVDALAQSAEEVVTRRAVLADGFQYVGARLGEEEAPRLDEGMREAAARYVARHPDEYAYVGGAALADELATTPNHEAQLGLARKTMKIGQAAFRQLDRASAAELFAQSLESYDAILHDLVAPEEVAEVLLYLALSELDERRTLSAIEHMQRMILLDASRELERGFWPDDAVDAYQQARRGLERDLRLGPQRFVARARAIASRLGADVVYFSAVLPAQGGQVEVLLFPYVVAQDAFDPTERVLLTGPTPGRVDDAIGRLMSRHASCIREAIEEAIPVVPPSQGRSPLSVQVNMSYASFLRYPRTLDVPFGNYGLGLGAQWLLTRDFGLVSSVQILVSQSQFSGLVATENFPTIRGFLGAELGYRVGKWRASVQVAGDLTHVSAFSVWGNVPCVTRTDCNPDLDQITYDEYGLMLGVNARPSLSYRLDRSLELIARASGSYFFLAGGDELNFPLGADVGLEYRF